MSTRDEINASIARTEAVLARLTPAQFEQVNSRMVAELDQWCREDLAQVRARRMASASPYVERASIVACMGRALRDLSDIELDDYPARFHEYCRASIDRNDITEHDKAALASELMRRVVMRLERRKAKSGGTGGSN